MVVVEQGSKVAQLDAILLDHELLNSLIFQFTETFSQYYKQQVIKYSSEIRLIIRSLLFKFTLWDTSNTYGFFLSNLKLLHAGDNLLSKKIKLVYYFIFIFGDYLMHKFNDKIFIEDDFNADSGSNIKRLVKQVLINFSKALKFANFINFISFLINGRFNNLKFWLLNITTGIQSVDFDKSFKGMVNYDFQNRQIIWNTLIEFVEFLTPFLKNLKKLQLKSKRNSNKNGQFLENLQGYNPLSAYLNGKSNNHEDATDEKKEVKEAQLPIAKYANLDVSECAICHENNREQKRESTPSQENISSVLQEPSEQHVSATPSGNILHPIISPYITSCGHVYSYLCLLEKLEDYSSSMNLSFFQTNPVEVIENEGFEDNGDYWRCLRCNKAVLWCSPYIEQHEDFQLEEYNSESESEAERESENENENENEEDYEDRNRDGSDEEDDQEDEYNSYYETVDEEKDDSLNHQENHVSDNTNDSASLYNSFSLYENVEDTFGHEKQADNENSTNPTFGGNEDKGLDFGSSQLF